jgi:mono/diheme cytochrome c family protein
MKGTKVVVFSKGVKAVVSGNRVKVFVFWAGVLAAFVWVAGASVGASTAAAPQGGRASQVERGREVYADKCQRCHGADGQGHTRLGEEVNPPDLSDPALHRRRGAARMIASVTNGRGGMPAFRQKLSRQQIADSVAYVRTLRR